MHLKTYTQTLLNFLRQSGPSSYTLYARRITKINSHLFVQTDHISLCCGVPLNETSDPLLPGIL